MLLPVSVYLIPLFGFIVVPLSLLLHFYFAVWRTRCPCPCLPIWVVLHCLYGCLSCRTRIICDVVVLCLFRSCLSFISWAESLPGEDVLCRLLSRPHPYICFLPCLFVLFYISLRLCLFSVCFGVISSTM